MKILEEVEHVRPFLIEEYCREGCVGIVSRVYEGFVGTKLTAASPHRMSHILIVSLQDTLTYYGVPTVVKCLGLIVGRVWHAAGGKISPGSWLESTGAVNHSAVMLTTGINLTIEHINRVSNPRE